MNRKQIHWLFWLCYIVMYGYLATPFNSLSYLPVLERLVRGYGATVIVLPVYLLFCYGMLYYMPRLYAQRIKFVIGISLFVILNIGLYRLLMDGIVSPYMYLKDLSKLPDTVVRYTVEWLLSLLNLLTPLSILGVFELLIVRAEDAEREKSLIYEKLKSELRFLRSQTNPHFLFNTLNNIYHLARKQSGQTPDAILRLSGLLRYMIYDCQADKVTVQQEMDAIKDYIELEKLRYDDRLSIQIQYNIDNSTREIAPLILIPIVENCFKHGSSESKAQCSINLRFALKGDVFECIAENSYNEHTSINPTGIGLSSVKRQCELQYSDFTFNILAKDGTFTVHLTLNLAHEKDSK